MRNRLKMFTMILIVLFISLASTGFAAVKVCRGDLNVGSGVIRIEPHMPIMLTSTATFEISIVDVGASNPNILLVMTKSCYEGLAGDVVVEWVNGSTSFPKTSFAAADSGYIPPSGTTSNARYNVSSLKQILGTLDTLYYVYGPFLSRTITWIPQVFNVTLPSTHPRMLVYALGKSPCSNLFSLKVPQDRPGFIVPDLAPIVLALASFSAFGLYAIKRRKT